MNRYGGKDGPSASRYGLRVALIYGIISTLWIVFSDMAVGFFAGRDISAIHMAQTIKGSFFVVASSALIYYLTSRTIRSIRRSQEALRESERLLFTLFNNLPGMVYRCKDRVSCSFDFVSTGALELTGYADSELTKPLQLTELTVEEDRARVEDEVRRAMDERRPFRLSYRIRCADGSIKWILEQGLGIYSQTGQLTEVEGFLADITERKLAEEALERSDEVNTALVDGTSDAILMVDSNRNIISVNKAFIELFGYSREELEGHSVRLVHPSEQSFLSFGRMAYTALEQAPMRIEWELQKKDGTLIPIEGTYSAIKGQDGSVRGHVGIIRDITDRKRAETELKEYREHLEEMVRERTRELEEAQKALVQREKLKTLGAVAAEVAHGIRNPLVSIGGFARRLKTKYPDSREAEIILRESQRLEVMLNRLSEYLRPVELKPRESHVNAILSASIDMLAPELEKENARVNLELQQGLPSAHVDPSVLPQVFIAMIRNALQMMDSKKEITIRTYYGEHNVYVDMIIMVSEGKVKDPELLLLPFDDSGEGLGISSTFQLLKGMGGSLSFSQFESRAVFTASLVKCQAEIHDEDQEWSEAG